MKLVAPLLLFAVVCAAHEVPIHKAITEAAVKYLIENFLEEVTDQQRADFLKCASFIEALLLIGAESEDAAYGNRFMFHFTPALNDDTTIFTPESTRVEADCSSVKWAFSSDPNETTLSQHCRHNQQDDLTVLPKRVKALSPRQIKIGAILGTFCICFRI